MNFVGARLAAFIAACAFSTLVSAQSIDASSFIVPNGTDLEVAGEARYIDASGSPSAVAMSGNLTLFEYVLGSSTDQVNNYTWATDSGAWSGSYHHNGDESWCYYATINAIVRWWAEGTTTEADSRTSDYCVPRSNNPPPGGGDLCTIGNEVPSGGQPCTPIVVNLETGVRALGRSGSGAV
ncbi:MAG TPA: hypothetical protein VHW00_03420 [Thermoanaerobaculia bacterium]|nr:hypothetical protein [Thermoanaerobaculia bacterium]